MLVSQSLETYVPRRTRNGFQPQNNHITHLSSNSTCSTTKKGSDQCCITFMLVSIQRSASSTRRFTGPNLSRNPKAKYGAPLRPWPLDPGLGCPAHGKTQWLLTRNANLEPAANSSAPSHELQNHIVRELPVANPSMSLAFPRPPSTRAKPSQMPRLAPQLPQRLQGRRCNACCAACSPDRYAPCTVEGYSLLQCSPAKKTSGDRARDQQTLCVGVCVCGFKTHKCDLKSLRNTE